MTMDQQELHPPREPIIDLALLLEEHLEREGESWWSGDQVMDLHALKKRLKEEHAALEETLGRITLQGTALVLTRPQKRSVRRDAVALAGVCMHILQACELLDPLDDVEAPNRL
jgi:hypothetical protein